MKKIGIMQPYFLPYIGYFQLMNYVDEFIVYDNIQFTKKGWIHRNRMLQNGKDEYFTLPLKKDSDFLNVNQRFLSDSFSQERVKMLNKIQNNYRKAQHFDKVFPILIDILNYPSDNLFEFIFNSISKIKLYLEIQTPLIISSSFSISDNLKGKDKVMELVKESQGSDYINPIGGLELYDKDEFSDKGIKLMFLKTNNFHYPQFKNEFIPFLSILDVMMFNDKDKIHGFLNEFELQ